MLVVCGPDVRCSLCMLRCRLPCVFLKMVMLRYSEIWVASFALLQYLYCKERAIAMRQLSHVVHTNFIYNMFQFQNPNHRTHLPNFAHHMGHWLR